MADNNDVSSLKYYVDGPAALYCGPAKCGATDYVPYASGFLVGLTDGGVTISYQTITHRINGDEYGGAEGMPAELLILGGMASIRTTIVKWAENGFKRLIAGANLVADDGQIPALASPYFSDNYGFAFWVVGKGLSYYFPKCELATQPRTWNISSLERRMDLSIQALCIFNATNESSGSGYTRRGEAITFFKGTETASFEADCSAVIE